MRHIYTIAYLLIAAIFLASCSEENLLKPYGKDDGVPPGKVEMRSYEQLPGGVEVKYIAPPDEDLMYIKIVYTLDTGVKKEAKSSVYSDRFTIEGFGNEKVKSLTMSAVDRHENEGESTTIEVVPGKPSYLKAFETLKTGDTFGGMSVIYENVDLKPLILDVLTEDSIGYWYNVQTEYPASSQKDAKFAVRGFEPTPRLFKVVVRDGWDNVSDTIETLINPLYEIQIPRSGFKRFVLPTDLSVDAWSLSMEQLWSGEVKWGSYNMCHSDNFDDFPQWFTFDMGVKATLSRYKYWQRLSEDQLYRHGNMETWEIWGHPDTPPLDGSWDGWILLHESTSIKPSGLPLGVHTKEDIDYATKGEEFEFEMGLPAVRYIRVKPMSTFSKERFIHIQQLWFWGDPRETSED